MYVVFRRRYGYSSAVPATPGGAGGNCGVSTARRSVQILLQAKFVLAEV